MNYWNEKKRMRGLTADCDMRNKKDQEKLKDIWINNGLFPPVYYLIIN